MMRKTECAHFSNDVAKGLTGKILTGKEKGNSAVTHGRIMPVGLAGRLKHKKKMKSMTIKSFLIIAYLSACLHSPAQNVAGTTETGAAEDRRTAVEDTFVDASLRSLLCHDDYDRLVAGKEKALAILRALDNGAYGREEYGRVGRLLTGKELPLSPEELKEYRRVRSVQVNNMGIFSYPYFPCRFRDKDGRIFFEKLRGSQRKSGFVYDNKPAAKLFLGGWSVNDEPQTVYGSNNSEAGMVYKTEDGKLIMLFVTPGRAFEIYELGK
ncbi:MAG: DUF4893 domain-containing protein [Bacteroidales bacterium]|nr:DUF4893 domain-containing protein [Bacteroidales bacterium]MCM1146666.1 DUF4893 domain-containing protein [Bacteroidales bacterium]MCM1206056.1 DUF4893 domain-containing protein [Bacillota bacterium]MCM1511041.1 DUF4893 domain-containing protein [Clostridium sp.]